MKRGAPAAWPQDFDPTLLSHGRLLWRFEGSDGARFSPRLAWGLLDEVTAGETPLALWDPFCGTGLIPAIAALFFGERLAGVHASDLDPRAAAVAERNLALVTDAGAAEARRREAVGRQGQNPKSERRWGDVVRYVERLRPRIERAQARALPVACWNGPAHRLPQVAGPLCIVGDAPYGKQTVLEGAPLADLVQGWMGSERVARIALVAAGFPAPLPAHPDFEGSVRPIRGGREVFLASRRTF